MIVDYGIACMNPKPSTEQTTLDGLAKQLRNDEGYVNISYNKNCILYTTSLLSKHGEL